MLLGALKICNMADSKFDYNDTQLAYWAERIIKRHPDMLMPKLIEIIQAGTEGRWKDKYYQNVNLSMIFDWIEKFLKEEKEAAEKKEKEDFARDAEAGMKLYMNIEQYRAWKKSGSIQSEIEKYQNMKF